MVHEALLSLAAGFVPKPLASLGLKYPLGQNQGLAWLALVLLPAPRDFSEWLPESLPPLSFHSELCGLRRSGISIIYTS